MILSGLKVMCSTATSDFRSFFFILNLINMKIQSQGGSMVVDYYPIKMPSGIVSKEWFLKVLSFQGATQSKKFLNRVEMNLDIQEHLNHTIPYEVVDFNTIPQLANPFAS